ncbi:MAG TPA: Xaa-Pro peptidase family protein [Terriglobales bacterium]|nr:Xaa-Pro peptidase family protein [Terriglobales bacterium]
MSSARDPERHARIVDALHVSGLDAFLCALPSQVLLLTGYWPVMATSVAVFTSAGEVHLIVPEDETELAKQSSAAERTTYRPASLSAITDAQKAIHGPLIQAVKKLGLSAARVGMELGQFVQASSYAVMNFFGAGLGEILRQNVPGLTMVAATDDFERLKAIKTPHELAKIRSASRIAEAAFDCGKHQVRAGRSEPEIASAFQSAFERTPLAAEVHRSYGFFFCMSGPNSATAAAAYARTRQRTVNAGDLVMTHCNSCGDGFWTDITRTYTAGTRDPRQEQMHGAIMEARQAALSVITPGISARDVDRAAREVLDRHGYGAQFKHAAGHGVGFAAANHNGIPRIHPQSPDVLTEGMTFNIEPAIYFEGYGGMRHCDVVAVTTRGVEVLTDF